MDQEVRDGERDGTGSEASMDVVDESKEVRDSERDSTGPEASVDVVDESKEVQDSERDSPGPEANMHLDSVFHKARDGESDSTVLEVSMGLVEVTNQELESALEMMDPLHGVISDLLWKQQQQHGGRGLTVAVDRTLRSWQFIEFELRTIIALLRVLQEQRLDLGRAFIDSGDGIKVWFENELCPLARTISAQLGGTDQPRLGGCQARLHRAAARCFRRDAGRSLFYSTGEKMREVTMTLYQAAESPLKYEYLMLAGDVERTFRGRCAAAQPHPYAAHAGAGASLVGIEGALRSKQLRWFMADGQETDKNTLKVMAMVGPAGVGKTALAMEVHRQLQEIEERHRFQHCATAKVSQSPDIKELLKHILSQMDKLAAYQLENAGHVMLASRINQCLQEKRYLVTIHDVWKETDWDTIKNAFPENNLGSRIMITTQLRSVAQFCCSHSADGLVLQVMPLGALDSKRLLFKKAFGSEDGCPTENLKQVCDEILRRCEGIPLFIIGMAGWLHEQLQKAQGINYSMETVPKLLEQFEQTLATIYDDLPYDLKVMLMYMRVFSEGYTFDKDTLVGKWIDHGMIISQYRSLITEIARKFLRELINRNIVTRVAASSRHNLQVEEAYHWHVSYFMLQFLASKSAQFLASESADDHGFVCTLDSVGAEGGKTVLRRLSLHQPRPELLTLLRRMDLSLTRLLYVSGEVSQIPLDEFGHLVVLDLEGWQSFKDDDMLLVCKMLLLRYLSLRNVTGVSKLPPEIKELQHLLSLDISQTSICELPSQLCELYLLEKLDLRSTKVRQLPQRFWKLESLECLLVGGDGVAGNETVITEISEEIKHLGMLRILTVVDLTRCSPSLVDALGVLFPVELAITWSFHQCTDRRFQKALCSSMREWNSLKSLTIHCGLGCRMDFLDFSHVDDRYLLPNIKKFKIVDGRFARVPKWFRGLRGLTFIEITICAVLPGDLGLLGTSRTLEYLVLGLDFIPEAELVIGAEQHPIDEDDPDQDDHYVSFCGLRRLSVSCRVPWLTFSQGAMPELTFLELKIAGSPVSQESVPSGISNLGRLSDVAIRFHANYTNSPSVKMTVEAVKKGIAEHRMPINLFINDIEDQGEDFQSAEEGPPRASGRQSEIQNEESSIRDQEEDVVQAVEAGPASEIEELE